MAFQHQVNDLKAEAQAYLARNEPLPTTVRNAHARIQVSEFMYLFARDKTFGLTGTIELANGSSASLITEAELFVYNTPGGVRRSLGVIFDEDIGQRGGVVLDFQNKAFAPGTFRLYVKSVNGANQVWGHIKARVPSRATGKDFDEDLYLCPVTPAASR